MRPSPPEARGRSSRPIRPEHSACRSTGTLIRSGTWSGAASAGSSSSAASPPATRRPPATTSPSSSSPPASSGSDEGPQERALRHREPGRQSLTCRDRRHGQWSDHPIMIGTAIIWPADTFSRQGIWCGGSMTKNGLESDRPASGLGGLMTILAGWYGGEVMGAVVTDRSGLSTGRVRSPAVAGRAGRRVELQREGPVHPRLSAGFFPADRRSGGTERATRGFAQRLGGER